MSFYRKYRPQIINEIDNKSVQERLLTLLTKDRRELPHAFLFIGPKGTGKTTAARIIAKIFNCQKLLRSFGPCGKCDQCRAIAENTNIDVLEIDAASNRGIDEIRSLRERINLAPAEADFKIYIIDEVHMLTTEAFNALLKTLEEPPDHAVFVLATTDPQKIPATIKSRCMMIYFNRASSEELKSALKRIARREKIKIDAAATEIIIAYAEGSFRDAVKLLEQLSFHKGVISQDVARSLLAVSEEKIQKDFLEQVAKREMQKALLVLDTVIERGSDVKAFLVDCLIFLEKELVAAVSGKKSFFGNIEDLKDLIRRFSQAYAEMKSAAIIQLPLELAIVEYCEIRKDLNQETSGAPAVTEPEAAVNQPAASGGFLTLEKLSEHWKDIIEELKPFNHSVAGVLRSSRPKAVGSGIVTLEAFYRFHQEKLSESKNREALAAALKKLFGEKVKVEIVLGKK